MKKKINDFINRKIYQMILRQKRELAILRLMFERQYQGFVKAGDDRALITFWYNTKTGEVRISARKTFPEKPNKESKEP